MTNFISQAPVKNKIEVIVSLADFSDGWHWDREIRPVLMKQFPGRTNYRWSGIIGAMPYLRKVAFGLESSDVYALGLFVRTPDDVEVLAGLTLLAEGVVFPNAPSEKCVYVWFLQAAPEEYLRAKGLTLIPKVGEVLLDSAIVSSMEAGLGGRVLLHAAPSGGSALMDVYGNFGLHQVDKSKKVAIRSSDNPLRCVHNDGRFFYADEPTAEYIVRKNKR